MLGSRSAISSPASLRLKGACDRSTTSRMGTRALPTRRVVERGSSGLSSRGTSASSSAASSRTSRAWSRRRRRLLGAGRRLHAWRDVIAPARRAAHDVVLRVFEQDAYADRRSPRRRRPSTPATGRSRSGSRTGRFSASARSTTRSRRWAAGRCGSSMRPSGPRSGSARTSSATSIPSRRMPRWASRSSSSGSRAGAGGCLHECDPPAAGGGIRELLDALPEGTPTESALKPLPGLDRRHLVA